MKNSSNQLGTSTLYHDILAPENTRQALHHHEVNYVVTRYKKHGAEAVKKYLLLVEEARGAESAERLRRDAWKQIQNKKVAK